MFLSILLVVRRGYYVLGKFESQCLYKENKYKYMYLPPALSVTERNIGNCVIYASRACGLRFVDYKMSLSHTKKER